MNVTKQEINKTTVAFTIELLSEELQPYVDRAVRKISNEVKVDGFRPGHVPLDILKNKVGEMAIYQEAADLAIQDALPKAVKQERLEFVGQPQVNVDKLAPHNPFVFTATFALMPSVDLKNYATVKVSKPEVKLDEANYKKKLDQLRQLRAVTKTVERAGQTGDRLTIDFTVTVAGVPIEGGQGKDVPAVIGEHQFIPGFEEQLVGMKAADHKTFKLTFPKDYGAKHLAGQEAEFNVTVKTVGEVTLPALDDVFAKELNFPSQADMEKAVRDNMVSELQRKADDDFEVAVLEAMIKQAEFDPIPEPLLENELNRMMDELQQQVEDQGGKFEEYLQHLKKTAEELRASWKDRAAQRVKSALLIKAVGDKENITVTEDAITAEIAKQKTAYKDQPTILGQLDSLEFRGYTRTILRNQQALERLKQLASQA